MIHNCVDGFRNLNHRNLKNPNLPKTSLYFIVHVICHIFHVQCSNHVIIIT